MTTNRYGQRVELNTLEKVIDEGDSYSLTLQGSWSLFVSKRECGDFVPQVGDWILVSYQGFNSIAGIIIEGRVLRAKTPEQIEAEHQQWKRDYRLEKLERYLEHGDALKERVKKLHPALQARMARFDSEGGVEFWIDSAPYEMAVLEGAQALLNKTEELGLSGNDAVRWVEDWWALNTKEHNYDYKRQMEMVPDFGDGHSGNTAGAAYQMALMLLDGRGNEL